MDDSKPSDPDPVKAFLSLAGRKGGRSKSAKKIRAVKANLAKVRRNRWKPKGIQSTLVEDNHGH